MPIFVIIITTFSIILLANKITMRSTSEETRVFIEVVEQKSFSKAAEKLNLANSAVSRSVKKLEEKLGVNLLNRTTRQIDLTAEENEVKKFL